MFLMVLDTAVMNVSISQLVADFDTEVTAIQATITLYTLVMAAFMITGARSATWSARRRAFTVRCASTASAPASPRRRRRCPCWCSAGWLRSSARSSW